MDDCLADFCGLNNSKYQSYVHEHNIMQREMEEDAKARQGDQLLDESPSSSGTSARSSNVDVEMQAMPINPYDVKGKGIAQ